MPSLTDSMESMHADGGGQTHHDHHRLPEAHLRLLKFRAETIQIWRSMVYAMS